MRIYFAALVGILLLIGSGTGSAQSLLSREISIKARETSIKELLREIEKQGNLKFSYSDDVVPVEKKITLNLRQVRVSEALDQILANTFIDYRENGNQILLFRKRLNLDPEKKFTVSGFVREAVSGEPLLGVNLLIRGSGLGTTTNAYGYYSLTASSDTFHLLISYVGFSSVDQFILLDRDIELNINLETNNELHEVVVEARKNDVPAELISLSKMEVPVAQIQDIPQLFGEKDVFKVMKLMPGVQSGNEGQTGLYVRGGGNDQNLIILDDATVYNASHFFGFFSLFNGDALRSVELTKGGFPARYGGRLSSVLDIHMKDGNKREYHGTGGIGLLSSRLTLEGPIKKDVSSFLISGRRTYLLDLMLKPLMSQSMDLGMYFYDITAKADWIFSDKDKLILSFYTGRDRLYLEEGSGSYKAKSSINWSNVTGTLRWNHVFNKKIFSNTSLIFSDYRLRINSQADYAGKLYQLNLGSGIRDLSLKSDFDYSPNSRHALRYGGILTYHRFNPQAVYERNDFIDLEVEGSELYHSGEMALYGEDIYHLSSRWRVHSGLRLVNFFARGKDYFRIEPRLMLIYAPDANQSFKFSYTIMNQFIHLLTNTGVGLPTDLWVPSTENIRPQHSQQLAVGYSYLINKINSIVSAELYYKRSRNVIGYKEGATFVEVAQNGIPEKVNWEQNITQGQGTSYGAELLIQKKFGKLTGWLGYTLSWSWLQFDDLNDGKPFYARYDRRHDISLVGIYRFNERISLSSSWVYGTGSAITLPVARYYTLPHNPADPVPPSTLNFQLVNEYGGRNQYRMSPYHRLDFAIQFHKKKKYWERTWEISVYNLYNRKNPYFYYINNENSKLQQMSLLPIIPSISYSFKF